MAFSTFCPVSGEKCLSDGLLELITTSKNDRLNPIVQILNLKVQSTKQIQVLLSDGQSCISNCMFASEQIDRYYREGKLSNFTVVCLEKYEISPMPQTPQYSMLTVKELTILKPGLKIGHKLERAERFSICSEEFLSKRVPTTATPTAPERLNAVVRTRPQILRQTTPQCSSVMGQTLMGIGMDPEYYLSEDWEDEEGFDYEEILPTNQHYPINSLSPFTITWTIRGRVIRKSPIRHIDKSNGPKQLFDFELKDETGQIDIVAFDGDCDKFYGIIEKHRLYFISGGQLKNSDKRYHTNQYQITLNAGSSIRPCYDAVQAIPKLPSFNFIPLSQLNSTQTGTLVDVIGAIKSVGESQIKFIRRTQREAQTKDIQLIDKSNAEVLLTLWNEMATEFTGMPGQIMALKGVSVCEFKGKHLSAYGNTFIEVNPSIPEARELQRWYTQLNGAARRSFTVISRRAPSPMPSLICHINTGEGGESKFYNVIGRIMVLSSGDHFYEACVTKDCFKKVTRDGNNIGLYLCTKCKNVSPNHRLRFKLSFMLSDVCGSIWVTAFGRHTEKLFARTEDQLIELHQNDPPQCRQLLNSLLLRRFNLRLCARLTTYNGQPQQSISLSAVQPLNTKSFCEQLICKVDFLSKHPYLREGFPQIPGRSHPYRHAY